MLDAIKLLLVEDTSEDAEILIREMRKGGLGMSVQRVDTRDGLERALESFAPDVILSDYTLPGFGGMTALKIVRQRRPDTPFIFVSGTIGEERAIEALREGATDYVLKDNRARLVPAVRRALAEAADRRARWRAERESAHSEQRFRLFMQHLPGAAFMKDTEGRFTYVNAGTERIIGKHRDEILGRTVAELYPPEFSHDYRANDEQAMTSGAVIEAIEPAPMDDGTHYFLSHKFPIPAPGDEAASLGGISLDLTERLHAEEARRMSEERFRSIAEATQEWIWETDAQGLLTYSNAAVEKMLGHACDELIGTTAFGHFLPGGRAALADPQQRADPARGGWNDVLLRCTHRDGSLRWLESTALPLLGPGQALVGYRGTERDVTERILQQQRIARLSRIHTVLSAINATIVRLRDRQELFREVCRIAVDHGGFRLAWIGLADAGRVTPVAWAGFEQGYLADVGQGLLGVAQDPSSAGRALRSLEPVVVNDIEADDEVAFKQEALARGYRSLAALPLLVEGKAVGVVVLYAAETAFFSEDELKLLASLAADLSFALEHIEKGERLAYVSYYDTLTGLPNQQLFTERLSQMIKAAAGEQRTVSVIVVELPQFRKINDTLGRGAGDKLLRDVAARLQASFFKTAARIGGDRFAVTVGDLGGPAVGLLLEAWLAQSFARPIDIDGVDVRVAAKVGVAFFPTDGTTAETLSTNAEAALQLARDSSASFAFYAPEMNTRVSQHLRLESRLRKAIAEQQFILHYQPKVDLATRAIVGLEALIRWRDPAHGLVSPLEFVPVLEETGLIVEVGRWVIEQAVRDMRAWAERGLTVPRTAVNVSQVQLRQKDFVAAVFASLETPQGRHAGIDLEITESLLAQDAEANVDKLKQLRAAGMHIHMDDFGTGYSSLSQIAQLPLDALKIDRAFIVNMVASHEHMAIVSTIVRLAQALRIAVVAEGVETEQQAEILKSLACDQAQGYLFSRPLPAEDIARLLAVGADLPKRP